LSGPRALELLRHELGATVAITGGAGIDQVTADLLA
jgi:hypothetical protein